MFLLWDGSFLWSLFTVFVLCHFSHIDFVFYVNLETMKENKG